MIAVAQSKLNRWLIMLGLLPLFGVLGGLSVFINDRYTSAIAFAPLLLAIGYSWFWFIAPTDDRQMLLRMFTSAVLIRFVASFVLEFLWSRFEGSSDGAAYGPHATAIAEAWHQIGLVRYADVVVTPVGAPGYVYFAATLFWLFGANTLYLKLANGLFAALASIYTYKIGRHYFERRVGIFAGWLVALMPSMILWTSQNLKDSIVVFLSVWIIWIASNSLRVSLMRIPLLVGLVLILASIRAETALGLAIIISLTLLFQSSLHWFPRSIATLIAVTLLGLGLSSTGFGFLGQDYLQERLSFEAITDKRIANSTGTGTIESTTDTNSFGGFMAYLPFAVTNFLLRPWPWEATKSLNQIMSIPESLFLWYPLFGFALYGLGRIWQTHALKTTLLWIYVIGATIAAAPQYGNYGTAYRHRIQLWPIIFIFAAVGWYAWRDAQMQQKPIFVANTLTRK